MCLLFVVFSCFLMFYHIDEEAPIHPIHLYTYTPIHLYTYTPIPIQCRFRVSHRLVLNCFLMRLCDGFVQSRL